MRFFEKMDFEAAVERVRSSSAETTDEVKLELYALYKQASVGPCHTKQPWAIQVVERAKWEAWRALGDMDRAAARQRYCAVCEMHSL